MFSRDWLATCTVWGCVIAALLLSAGTGYSQNTPSVEAQRPSLQQQAASPAVVQASNGQGEAYKSDCTKPKDHDAADICEQRRMAKAAEDAVWWARLQTWLGGFGFAAVLLTLVFTGIATRAASRQASLSRHALVDTERAFVFPKITQWKAVKDLKTEKVTMWKIALEWQNLGNTPTRHLRLNINSALRPDALPENFEFPDGEVANEHPLVIAPGLTIESREIAFTLDEMESIQSGTKNLYVWGWAEYDDVFERTPRHRTEFCHLWSIGGNIRDLSRFSSRYSIHARYNGADEECEGAIRTASPKDQGGR